MQKSAEATERKTAAASESMMAAEWEQRWAMVSVEAKERHLVSWWASLWAATLAQPLVAVLEVE